MSFFNRFRRGAPAKATTAINQGEFVKELHRFAKHSHSRVMKKPIFARHMYRGISILCNVQHPLSFATIPVKMIRSLIVVDDHEIGREPKNSYLWHELLETIYGCGWTEQTFEYFEQPTLMSEFHSCGLSNALSFFVLGGLVVCHNGNHRVVGGVPYLVRKYGDDACIKHAAINFRPVNSVLQAFLLDLTSSTSSLRVSVKRLQTGSDVTSNVLILRIQRKRSIEYYCEQHNSIMPLEDSALKKLDYEPLFLPLLEIALDSRWIDAQLPMYAPS